MAFLEEFAVAEDIQEELADLGTERWLAAAASFVIVPAAGPSGVAEGCRTEAVAVEAFAAVAVAV